MFEGNFIIIIIIIIIIHFRTLWQSQRQKQHITWEASFSSVGVKTAVLHFSVLVALLRHFVSKHTNKISSKWYNYTLQYRSWELRAAELRKM